MKTGFCWSYLYNIDVIDPIGWESLSSFHVEVISEEEFQNRLLKSYFLVLLYEEPVLV
jgi:hypothetical protein